MYKINEEVLMKLEVNGNLVVKISCNKVYFTQSITAKFKEINIWAEHSQIMHI